MACNKRLTRACLFIAAFLLALAPCAQGAPPLPLTEDDLLFRFGEEVYALGSPAAPLVEAVNRVSPPLDVQEVDSCLFSGKDKEFVNEQLLIGTLPRGQGGQDLIETIMVLNGDHLTARGIGIGNLEQEVLKAYGEPFLKDYDLLIYHLGDGQDGPQLVFVLNLQDDSVLSYYYFLNTQG